MKMQKQKIQKQRKKTIFNVLQFDKSSVTNKDIQNVLNDEYYEIKERCFILKNFKTISSDSLIFVILLY